jgi:hypothetical protein
MHIESKVHVDLLSLNKFKDEIPRQLNGGTGPVADALKLWAVRYRSFAQARFDIYSRGGGDWRALSAATIKKRRKGTKSNVLKLKELRSKKADSTVIQPTILRDTGLLFNALAPVFAEAPGAIEENIKFGVRVGYGGPQRHFLSGSKEIATIADIASFHQVGSSKLPQRKIIVDPPPYILSQMADDMVKALDVLAKRL